MLPCGEAHIERNCIFLPTASIDFASPVSEPPWKRVLQPQSELQMAAAPADL